MGQYNKAVLTTAGENLIARALAGEIKLSISAAKTSDYAYPGSTDLKSLTDMQGIRQTVRDPETKVLNDTMIQTRVLFSNEEISSIYYINNIGLYAMDGTEEVLFCIVTAETPDEMPQYSGVASTSFIYNIQNVVQDAAQLNITVSPSGTATIQDVLERVDATGGDISETVIETLDTVEDKYPVPAAGESVKRFFGKVFTFLKNIRPLTGDITLYVSTTGSDTTGDGTSGDPFKTIQHAIDILPKDLGGHEATINVSGGTYDEDLLISGFGTSGILWILLSGDITIRSLTVNGTYVILNSTTLHVLTTAYVLIRDGGNFNAYANVKITTTGYVIYDSRHCSILVYKQSTAYISNTLTLTGNTGTAVCVDTISKAYLYHVTGSGFGVGINIYSFSQLSCSIVDIDATVPVQKGNGGMIINANGTQIDGLTSSGLGCTWGTTYGGYYRHGNWTGAGTAQIIVQFRVTSTTALTAGVTYYVTGLPQPTLQGLTSIAVTTSQPSETRSAVLDTLGRITFVPLNNQPTGYTLTFSCTYITSN